MNTQPAGGDVSELRTGGASEDAIREDQTRRIVEWLRERGEAELSRPYAETSLEDQVDARRARGMHILLAAVIAREFGGKGCSDGPAFRSR